VKYFQSTVTAAFFTFAISSVSAASLVTTLQYSNDHNRIEGESRGAQKFKTTNELWVTTGLAIGGLAITDDQQINFRIYRDGAGNQPGGVEALVFSGDTGELGFRKTLGTFATNTIPTPAITLTPNTSYWLVLENLSNSPIWWSSSSTFGASRGSGFEQATQSIVGLTGSGWLSNSKPFTMDLIAIPEPQSSSLIMVSMGILFLRKRKQ
jgi:hypothetical protein